MRIKDNGAPEIFRLFLVQANKYGRKLFFSKRRLAVTLFLLTVMAVSFFAGVWLQNHGGWGAIRIVAERETGRAANILLANWFYVTGQLPTAERLDIDIPLESYEKLLAKREQAIASKGPLIASDADFVPARVRWDNANVKVDLRLKGFSPQHWSGDQWSLRIRVKGEASVMGMKRFAIHDPVTQQYLHQWLFLEAARSEGILVPKFEFVEVSINGSRPRIYALEEDPSQELVVRNNHREGVIVRFEDDLHFQEKAADARLGYSLDAVMRSFPTSPIEPIPAGKTFKDPVLKKQFEHAVSLLEGFRRGTIPTSQAFDAQKLAVFFALSDLFGAPHGVTWASPRFYYNPVTTRLMPILYDNEPGADISFLASNFPPLSFGGSYFEGGPTQFLTRIFSDMSFYELYLKELDRVSRPEYLEGFLGTMAGRIDGNSKLLLENPDPYASFSADAYGRNRERIRRFLEPVKVLHAYITRISPDQIELRMGNIQTIPMKVISVSAGGQTFLPKSPPVLTPWRSGKPVVYDLYPFFAEKQLENINSAEIKVSYRVLGTEKIISDLVFPWQQIYSDALKNDVLRRPSNYSEFKFAYYDPVSSAIRILPGEWAVRENLIFPPGTRVIIKGGTQLNLVEGASIISRSPLLVSGTEDAPVLFHSSDAKGGGIVVLEAPSRSIFEHAVFDGLSAPQEGRWELLGAVNIYESPAEFSHVHFEKNRSEDALSIIRSPYTVRDARFQNTPSDAIDADFSEGTIDDSYFSAIGGDAIDISAGLAEISNVTIQGTRDKGISAGEKTSVFLKNVHIEGSFVGIASKDLSEVNGDDILIEKTKIGVAVYRKKPEFGEASANLSGLYEKEVETPYALENGSTFIRNGSGVSPNFASVFQSLYGTLK